MTIRNLNFLFDPKSIVLIGASQTPGTVAGVLTGNVFGAGFKGEIFPINHINQNSEGIATYRDIASLPLAPDLAVIAAPPDTVPGLIDELGKRGTKAAVITAPRLATIAGPQGQKVNSAMLSAARPHLLRILGPNCLGIMVPGIGLHAGFGHLHPLPGNIAFVSQSGAVLTTVLDWATSRKIGFSHCVSLGDMIDVDFGDMLDYLANDYSTRAILLYLENATNARKFLSAARAAARNKPVIVVKTGESGERCRFADAPAGVTTSSDAVYEAVFRRAGILRVKDLQALFDAVQTLAMTRQVAGDRLAIVCNGGGIGVMAADTLIDRGGQLALPGQATMESLDQLPAASWSQTNPIVIDSDAADNHYADALRILDQDKETDAILLLHCPTALTSPTTTAEAVINTVNGRTSTYRQKAVLTCWLGDASVAEARTLFAQNNICTYATPTEAVRGFMQIVRYRKSQQMLMETPPSIADSFTPDTSGARQIIAGALADNRTWLSSAEARELLIAYAIPFVDSYTASSPETAAELAGKIGGLTALKILSADITHRSEVSGVSLNLETPVVVRENAAAMLQRVTEIRPDAHIEGFTVQPMVHRPHALELTISMVEDELFGPVLMVGQGGIADEVIGDKALTLPPLNLHLAHDALSQTRVYRLLQGYRGIPAADLASIELTLIKVSQLICDIAEVAELHLNPLLADEHGVLALDARVRVAKAEGAAVDRLAILPYPKELEESLRLPDGQLLLIRPIRPEDEPNFQNIFAGLTPEEIRLRFLHPMNTLPHSLAARLTQIDYDREMSLVVEGKNPVGEPELYGVVQITADPDKERAEFAIMLLHDMTGLGLGPMLLRRIIEYARSQGIGEIYGEVLGDNRSMLKLCRVFDFEIRSDREDPGIKQVLLKL
ncbi:bifunctional acetate--CoA ligase family protein/GNAT family N-acetyltransferase [Desulfopila sp. IMCC35006]|uniref:bifunctional acetate--CoA ligase family protein/GNAT family N-acetyltransferase n=1 Tax=Desulfopila sp. IMCC35006 TaxID=2569542 RepID=UPI0010AC2652|nr:bifunctional acetate--CoA ligase family protein/GNAT family N-acetyltransferase [Desulfopila sp. IMCC35006]TKB27451.1 bifunctional acetate--CoA ligase family protein/GNAT family N-acetyltransferase [Desulfopila sp. IMCC35006]